MNVQKISIHYNLFSSRSSRVLMKTIGFNKSKRRPQRTHKVGGHSESLNLPHLNKQRHYAQQMFDKYTQLARDANSNGDRVQAENYYQHADHFVRLLKEARDHIAQIMARQHHQINYEDDGPRDALRDQDMAIPCDQDISSY